MVRYTQKLRLSGLLQSLELRCREAADANLPLTEFLYRLLADEVERRDGKQLDVRLRRAAFERPSTLEDFDFSFNVSVPRTQVLELGTCTFVERHENVLVVGPAGVGKSHLAQALGQRACRAGHAVLYVSAHDMLTQLRASRADNSYERRLLRFTTPALLIIDDLGLRPLTGEEGIDMYEIVRRRYERVADFNADGRLDVAATIAAANTVSLFPGLGDGSLSERA
ncbi:transposition helper protein, IS21 family, truncated [Myxococcus xanthus DK 1622]|uniref:Transposition helper protein, IS21 family, truncated n=1 Tax=Myxococcus xanthus (strain DK1622) TaxID=246197 RepID=Q1DAI2_MYXXD